MQTYCTHKKLYERPCYLKVTSSQVPGQDYVQYKDLKFSNFGLPIREYKTKMQTDFLPVSQ